MLVIYWWCCWQIRSHAQKYFLKVQKNGTEAHVPPPRPKRKAAHPYPQKAPKNGLPPLHEFEHDLKHTINAFLASWFLSLLLSACFLAVLGPLQASAPYGSASVNSLSSGYHIWDDASMCGNDPSSGVTPTENDYDLLEVEGMFIFYK